MTFSTPDLCDDHAASLDNGDVKVMDNVFSAYGGRSHFSGNAVTVKCFEDNSKVKELAGNDGNGQVMVVDGGGSCRRALLGDMIAANAVKNGWSGFVFNGVIRDVDEINALDIGVRALGSCPVKTVKLGQGEVGISVVVAGQIVKNGDWIYVDNNGILVSKIPLL